MMGTSVSVMSPNVGAFIRLYAVESLSMGKGPRLIILPALCKNGKPDRVILVFASFGDPFAKPPDGSRLMLMPGVPAIELSLGYTAVQDCKAQFSVPVHNKLPLRL